MISIYNIMYESLLTIDDDYMPQGCLAKSWEENNSGKTWIFHLRDDVYFHDGGKMTAEDVKFSFDRGATCTQKSMIFFI